MFLDVVDLRDFYDGRLGRLARLMIAGQLRTLWPDLRGQRLLGLGYAIPYLRTYLDQAERVAALMPAQQGVLPWPADGANRAALIEESELPLPDYSIDRVLLVHGLEFSEQSQPLLKEIWRVLAPGGRLIVAVPNRRGLWARFDNTPFGAGSPFTAGQLTHLLREEEGFTPERSAGALFVPPSNWRFILRTAGLWERLGSRWFGAIGGVVLVEATKQIYAARPAAIRARRRRVLLPMPGTPSPAGP